MSLLCFFSKNATSHTRTHALPTQHARARPQELRTKNATKTQQKRNKNATCIVLYCIVKEKTTQKKNLCVCVFPFIAHTHFFNFENFGTMEKNKKPDFQPWPQKPWPMEQQPPNELNAQTWEFSPWPMEQQPPQKPWPMECEK